MTGISLYYLGMSSRAETPRIPDDWPLHARRYQYRFDQAHVDAMVNAIPLGPPIYDVHGAVEVGVMLSGEHVRIFAGQTVALRPGDVWMSAMWEPHGWYATLPDTRALVLCFLPDFLGEEMLGDVSWLSLFALPPERRPRVTEERMRQKILSLAQGMEEEIAEKPAGWASALRLGLLHVLLLLTRALPPAPLPADRIVRAGNLARVMPAVNLLYAKPTQRIGLPEAAADCGLSASQFARVFQRTFGVSFGKFTLRTRMAVASRLLATTDLPVGEIAEQTGFADGSHLHRMFTKHYGCTPGDYRHRMK